MIRTIAFTLIMLLPGAAYALGLGKLDLKSGLNEPFDARIELLSPTVDEIESLKVALASAEAFNRAGIDRNLVVTQLQFDVKEVEKGDDYIRVYSREVIREPFLNFLLEINWNRGRLLREYTVLLDPPTYSPNLKFQESLPPIEEIRTVPAPVTSAPSMDKPANTVVQDGHSIVYNPEYQASPSNRSVTPAPVSSAPSIQYTGGDYTTSAGDTLWGIASTMRPDSSVSIQQMMMALYRANPEAFINNNINGLKRGQILTMPSEAEMRSQNLTEALESVKSQNSLWDELKGAVASQVSERPESAGVSTPSIADESSAMDTNSDSANQLETDPELRLVTPEESSGSSQGTSEAGADAEVLSKDLAMAQETLTALESENVELKDKLIEAESIIDDLKRLIVLKEDELAALQNQMTEQPIEEMAEEVMEEEVIEEPMAEEVMEEEVVEEPMAEEVMEEEVVEEPMAEEVMEADVAQTDMGSSAGVMGMVDQYLGPAKEFVMQNLVMVGGGLGGILAVILGFIGFNKWRENKAEVVEFGEADIMDFDNIDSDSSAGGLMDLDDSESPTEVPDADELDEADVDITPTPQAPEEDDDATQIAGFDEEATQESVPAPDAEPEEDPLAEVNVFLAYEHFDQAADFVKSALEEQPDNLEFHTKLLEVYYAANDKKSYEEAAQVLHDKVSGTGEHWDMALAMWSEMSPNRALFEEREDGLDDTQEVPPGTAEAAKGGIVDLTAGEEDEKQSDTAGGLDFDIGDTTGENMLDVTASADEDAADTMEDTMSEANEEEGVLDITSDDSGEDILDVTAAEDVSDASDEDLLDVTSAVGLDMDEDTSEEVSSDEEEVLDLTGGSEEEVSLDLTADSGDDLLDMSSSGGEDLLDVTAATNIEPDSNEDLLDVTTASTMGADNSDLMDLDIPESTEDEGEATVDFDVEGLELDVNSDASTDDGLSLDNTPDDSVIERAMDDEATELDLENGETAADNVVEFDMTSGGNDDSNEIELDVSDESPSDGIDLDLSVPPNTDSALDEDSDLETDISLDLDMDETPSDSDEASSLDVDLASEDDLGLDLEIETEDTKAGLEVDLGDDTAAGVDLDLTNELSLEEENTESIAQDFEIDLEVQEEESSDSNEMDIDMEGTVEMPKMDFIDEDDDDDEQKTVFVPRSSDSDEQSLEDEVSTKLDLAKAYVELGDNDSAKTILDEIIAEGSDEQKQQAQELLNQVS